MVSPGSSVNQANGITTFLGTVQGAVNAAAGGAQLISGVNNVVVLGAAALAVLLLFKGK
jgi:hypothetical protein